tara:strand:+ start:498 stop:1133 length:636 start_codon:yes stop_codon:yes gene_type:complete
MHKNSYKIKVAFSCNKSFSNSIEELKLFLGFDLNKIKLPQEPSSINSENQVLMVDSISADKVHITKIEIPTILILKQNEKSTLSEKFDTIIRLPISFSQLKKTVIDLSQKHKFLQNSIIKIKDYILDKNGRFLKRNENFVKITEKEMHFIEELNSCSKPLKKDYILKNIWGYSSDTDTHTVETHIYRLRQKIKNQFNDNNFIKHTKEGYSF